MLRKLGICLMLAVFVAGSALAEDMLTQKPFQMYVGGGVLGQITMSRYRDGERIPYELHLDALVIPNLSVGVRYMTIPLRPGEAYEIDGTNYNLDWIGSKNLLLGRIGYIFPQESSHFGLFLNGGYSTVSVDWGQRTTGSSWEENDDTLSLGAFTLGGSILARSNLGIGNKCTPFNVWAELGYYRSFYSVDDSITILINPAVAQTPPVDPLRTLFTLAAGIEVNFFVPCPDFYGKEGKHWSESY